MKLAGSRKTWRRFVVAGLLTIHAGLLAYSAAVHSPTFNEPGHLVAGISYWQFGRFDVYKVNPPLSRLVAALPVLAAGCKTDWTQYYDGPGARPEMALGEAFVHANGERSIWLFTIARWACIPFSLLGGYIVFRWSRELYGTAAGILSLALWCFCPNILAHGSLITPDMSATAIGVAACYLFWHWLRRPTWWQTILTGAVLGVAELAKTTLLLFYFIWPVIWLVYRLPDWRNTRGRDWLRELGMLAACAILSIYVLNLGYGFEGTFTPLGKYRFVSDSLSGNSTGDRGPGAGDNRFADSWLAAIPVALPKSYVEGIDLQKRDFEHYGEKSYLNGIWADHGWWYYYLEALGLKVPLGTWLLLLLAATRRLWCGDWRIFRCLVRKMGLSPSRDVDRGLAHFAMPSEQNVPVPLSPEFPAGEDARTTNAAQLSLPLAAAVAAQLSLPLPFGGEGRGEGAVAGASRPPATWRDEFTLLFPALAILAFVSSQTGFNEHMRYVLPIFPFFFIWIGRVAAVSASRQTSRGLAHFAMPGEQNVPVPFCPSILIGRAALALASHKRIPQIFATAALAWSIASSLWIYPHSLSYFNELAGGPTGGPNYLLGSNVDWGQDLLFLKQWLGEHAEAKPLKLAYFGPADPSAFGIQYAAPAEFSEHVREAPAVPGWYAISVNFVRGMATSSFKGNGAEISFGRNAFVRFRQMKPSGAAGCSILVYHLVAAPAN